jgi:predicted nucleic acid-binding protein
MINKVLCDTDFLISLYVVEDSTHKIANELYIKCDECYVMNITLYEVATVLSRKLDQNLAVKIFNKIKSDFTNIVRISEEIEELVYYNFNKSKNKNQSFFDLACLVTAIENGYKIASFDKFYPSELLVR